MQFQYVKARGIYVKWREAHMLKGVVILKKPNKTTQNL
jgi:hypothetical protein